MKVRFPITPGSRNWVAIREAALMSAATEAALTAAAERAKDSDQEIVVDRSTGRAGRVNVKIIDRGSGDRMARRKALQAVLARVRL